MQLRISNWMALLCAVAVVSSLPSHAQAQPPSGDRPLRSEVAIEYTYLRSNAPPGGCGCFNMNGGSGSYAWDLKPQQFALVGEITGDHAGSISSGGYDLTLETYLAGVRYHVPVGSHAFHPFGQVLIGAAHAGGSLVEGNTPAAAATTVFAATLGGGVDLRATRHFSIRLIDADYLVSTFNNQINDHQNNLRISSGVVLRF